MYLSSLIRQASTTIAQCFLDATRHNIWPPSICSSINNFGIRSIQTKPQNGRGWWFQTILVKEPPETDELLENEGQFSPRMWPLRSYPFSSVDAPTSTHIPAVLSVLSEKQNNGNKIHQVHKSWSGFGDREKQKEREMNLIETHCVRIWTHSQKNENTRGGEMWL